MTLYHRISWAFLILFACVPVSVQADGYIEVQSTDGFEDDAFNDLLQIRDLSIRVDEVSGLYQVTVEAEIYNASDTNETEAEFFLPMPKGAIINDYALDIEGDLVSGVLTEKERAEKAYTEKVVDNIDPGIAERASDNRYKTRVYPVLENESRFIRLGFAVDGSDGLNWTIKTRKPVGKISFSGNAVGHLSDNPAYQEIEGVFTAENHLIDLSLDRHFDLVSNSIIARHKQGGLFLVTDISDKIDTSLEEFTSEKIAIIMDTSLSRAKDNHAAELNIIRRFVGDTKPESVRVIRGSDRIISDQEHSPAAALSELDEPWHFDGGSDINALLGFDGRYDMCLLLTDGHATIGRGILPKPNCPVYVISGSKDPNSAFLSELASGSGGHYVSDLSDMKPAMEKLKTPPGFSVKHKGELSAYRIGGHKIIVPVSRRKGRVEFKITDAIGRSITVRRKLSKLDIVDNAAPGTIWASFEAEALRAKGASVKEIIDFSRPFSIAGPDSALIVLEDPDDYVEADIVPPADYPEELMEEYREEMEWYAEEEIDEREYRLEDVFDIWAEQIDWWRNPIPKRKEEPMPAMSVQESGTEIEDETGDEVVVMGASPQEGAPEPEARDEQEDEVVVTGTNRQSSSDTNDSPIPQLGPNEVLVTGSRIENPNLEAPLIFQSEDGDDEIMVTASRIIGETIQVRGWSPDRPYLKAMSEAEKAERHETYQKQQAIYGDLPAFYLEMADYYNSVDNQTRAGQVVLSALELPAANQETLTQVAHRLLAYGQYDRAVELYRYALERAPHLPQSHLNLAVALHDRGLSLKGKRAQADFLEAVKNLEIVILTPWDYKYDGDYEGIELVALTEINAIIPRLDRRHRRKVELPKKLIKSLPLDIRAVMDWNHDYADMDLWVIEPSEEEAYYSNPTTDIGGQISNDMTEGYGPEQYALRNAVPGTFTVMADYYEDSEYNPNGAVSVRVRMTRNFGRDNQSTETVIVELNEEDEDEFVVGTFVFE